jgi:DNA invertase Pin-like site-specific DNA recombinase
VKTAIAYVRVSTQGQGKSGLGIEAQRAALARFAEAENFDPVETFEEIETGKGSDALEKRPQLAAALNLAKRHGAPIVVAKLDRLSRDVLLSFSLLDHDRKAKTGYLSVASLELDLDSIVAYEILAGLVEQRDAWNFPGRASVRCRNVSHNDL